MTTTPVILTKSPASVYTKESPLVIPLLFKHALKIAVTLALLWTMIFQLQLVQTIPKIYTTTKSSFLRHLPHPHCKSDEIPNINEIKNMGIVYSWVNGTLPCYQQMRKANGGTLGGSRDRTINELMYSFRSLEKFLPWHEGPIYLVSPGHIPYWLNLSHPRITVIDQDSLFPTKVAKEALPTFNTNAIEQYFYRIPKLPDLFMHINDDYLFTKPLVPTDFFDCHGDPLVLHEKGLVSNKPPAKATGIWAAGVLNTQQQMIRKWGISSNRYYMKHAPFVYRKSVALGVHESFKEPLIATLSHKFRNKEDVNWPLIYYGFALEKEEMSRIGLSTYVMPRSSLLDAIKLLAMKDSNMELIKPELNSILEGTSAYKIIALNDGNYKKSETVDVVKEFYQGFLPEQSSFEGAGDSPYTIRDSTTCEKNYSIIN